MTATRPARPREAPALMRILEAAYAPHLDALGPDAPPLSQDLEADIADGDCIVAGDPPRGFVVSRMSPDGVLIENLAVDPAAQGGGLGRALVTACEDRGREAGVSRARLMTSPALPETIAFYRALGYVEIGSDRQRVLMERLL